MTQFFAADINHNDRNHQHEDYGRDICIQKLTDGKHEFLAYPSGSYKSDH